LRSRPKDALSVLILLSVGSAAISAGQTPGSNRVKTPLGTISIAALRGFAGRVRLQAHGLPADATASFDPESLMARANRH
jgi:hypothetical protein